MSGNKSSQFKYPESTGNVVDTSEYAQKPPHDREGLPDDRSKEITGFNEPTPEEEPEELPAQEETVVEEVAEELNVGLPKVNLPLPMKLVAALSLVAGLSLISSLFMGAFSGKESVTGIEYAMSLAAGALLVGTAYGLIKRQNWATWLYGLLVFMSFFINWKLSIIPLGFLIYMIVNRKYLHVSIFDRAVGAFTKWFQKQMK